MLKKFNRLLAFAAALVAGLGLHAMPPAAQEPARRTAPPTASGDQNAIIERAVRRRALANARLVAAEHARPAREAAAAARAAAKGKVPSVSAKLAPGVAAPPGILNPLGTPDYMGGVVPNYANSPLIRKFVDTLPGLGAANANNLGNYIPLAIPKTGVYNDAIEDYYTIGVVDFTHQFSSDLPATHVRGYKDLNPAADGAAHYLGPVIIAQRDRAVRVKMVNQLPTGAAGNLPIPVDTSLMGSGNGPSGSTFTQNRALFHLHGGLNPWISDGTPHQWVTPFGDPTANKKGASFRNVPDMIGKDGVTDQPGDGIATWYWTNQQSGRFMFYHDHSFGLTRLNVYMGEAAGYLIVDPEDDKLIAADVLPGRLMPAEYKYGIPLIIQDKTFVPGLSDLAAQDPTWDTTNWGGYGDLWFPHVYMPNQNPSDSSGANAMGRWDYGPWFWPPVPVSDTAPNSIPTAHGPVPGANPGDPTTPGTPNPSLTPEAFMDTPVINGCAYPVMNVEPKAYRFRILNAANDRMFGMAFYEADPAAPTEVKMIPATPANAAAADAWFATHYPGDPNPPAWPTDGRDGGVVDFATSGPDIIQIGNESGFLPSPVVLHSQATTYNYNRRDIVVLDIDRHPLMLGPAERADIVVDFSAWAGKTLILYNDILAPVPAFDVRYDYFTGAPDQSFQGGMPGSLPGYGPNTRTLMQVKVAAAATPATTTAFSQAALDAAFTATPTSKSAFQATQHTPIVPQSFYNAALGTNFTDTYATIQANSLSFNKMENGAPVTETLLPKAIQELFELDYGRMNATLGIELPFTNFNNQTTIPLGYSEPATEILSDGTTQFWKITHNGVDTHPVHFHLFDVQIINRVGWDGAVRFPEANEVGWKETVKMKPLEDIIVAMRPISPKLAFVDANNPLATSQRVIDPTKDAASGITVTDLGNNFVNLGNLGNQMTISNSNGPDLVTAGPGYDYGWEYVWHCHILGHEENDFMRPMVLKVATTLPAAPTALSGNSSAATRIDLTWTKTALTPNAAPADGVPVPVDETGFRIERQTGGAGPFTVIGHTVPDETHFSDMTAVDGTSYVYQVYSYNQKGDSATAAVSAPVVAGAVTPATSVALTVSTAPAVSSPFGTIGIAFTATPTGGTGHQFQFLVNGALVQDYSPTATYTFPTTQAVGVYTVAVNVRTSLASAVVSSSLGYTITAGPATGVQLLPNLPSPQASGKVIFTAQGVGSTGYEYQFSLDGNVVQAYSATKTFRPTFVTAGAHLINVDVRTNTASLVPDVSASLSYSFTAATPATGVIVTSSLPSPQLVGTAVTFTAQGTGSNSVDYFYRFYLGATLVQSGTSNTWTMPTSTPAGNYTVEVNVSSSVAVWSQALTSVPFTIKSPLTPATGVAVTTDVASPQFAGTAVTFTATGSGSNTPAYLYRFYLGSTLVQSGTSNTWTMPASTPAGNYTVEVDVSADAAVWSQAMTFVPFVVKPIITPATGVTLSSDLASPQTSGTAVTFTATGLGSNTSAYLYRFYLGSTLMQTGTGNSWTLPASTPPGTYTVEVDVSADPTVWSQSLTIVTFVIN